MRPVIVKLFGTDDTAGTSGSVSRPAADATIAETAALDAGVYEVEVTTFQTGTVDAATPLNCKLLSDTAVAIDKLLTTATPARLRVPRVTVADQKKISVKAIAQPAVGSVVNATLAVTRIE